MKKQLFVLLLAAVMVIPLLSSCGGTEADTSPDVSQEISGSAAPLTSSATEDSLPDLNGHTLMIYCGAGMTNPFQEIADAFQKETGCEMNVTYANAGQIQSQITASKEGDMFIAGSADELKPVESYVTDQKNLVKHIPVLVVQAGNPKKITGLASLTEEGIRVIMGDVESTPIGKIAQKAFTDAGIIDQVTIVASTTTAPQISTAIAAGEADAAIVWKENSNIEGVEIVETEDMAPYVKTIPAASLSCSADSEALEAFNQYLDTDAAKEIWMKYGYEIAG